MSIISLLAFVSAYRQEVNTFECLCSLAEASSGLPVDTSVEEAKLVANLAKAYKVTTLVAKLATV